MKLSGGLPPIICGCDAAPGRMCGQEVRAPCGRCDRCCGHYQPDGGHICDGWALPRMERTGPLLLVTFFGTPWHVCGAAYTACSIDSLHDLSSDHFKLGGPEGVTCEACAKRHLDYVADYIVEDMLLNPQSRHPAASLLDPLIASAVQALNPADCEHKMGILKKEFPCPCLPPCFCHFTRTCNRHKLKYPKGQIRCDNPPWRNVRPWQAPARDRAVSGSLDALRERFSRPSTKS